MDAQQLQEEPGRATPVALPYDGWRGFEGPPWPTRGAWFWAVRRLPDYHRDKGLPSVVTSTTEAGLERAVFEQIQREAGLWQ